ncbi:MAG: hypothetical protein GY714_04415 [Desulfobacterales bacterium]|nr:hypothetical protein [Desulfobacterales bacterium]MCP4163327.1 hypothetical protein [Deltaproteobacteria bacterium]
MTTIPNLNVVIQQGGNARDAQNVRNQPQHTNSYVENQMPDKIQEQRTSVNELEEAEHSKLNKDKEGKRSYLRKKREAAKKRKKKSKKAARFEHPNGSGRLLDTIV